MNYYYTKPKLKPCKYPLKSSSLTLLDFLCVNKTTFATDFTINNDSIILHKDQYFSTNRRLAKNLNLSVKAIRNGIERLKQKDLLETKTVTMNNKKVGTVFQIIIGKKKGPLNTKKGPANLGLKKPKITRQKQAKNNAKKNTNKLCFYAQNKYNKINEDTMKIDLDFIKKSLSENIQNGTPENEKGAQHINKESKKEKEVVINNYLQKEKSKYESIELSNEELVRLFENFIFEYQKATNPSKIKPEFYIEKWASGIYHSWLTIENLCAMRGYFNAQKAKNQKIEFFKAFTRLIECVSLPEPNTPGYQTKLRERDIFISTFVKQGYTFYHDRIMPARQKQEIDQKQKQKDEKEADIYSFTKKYWNELKAVDPVEAAKIQNKANIRFGGCASGIRITNLLSRGKKGEMTESGQDHLNKFQFACIEIELGNDDVHKANIEDRKMPSDVKKEVSSC